MCARVYACVLVRMLVHPVCLCVSCAYAGVRLYLCVSECVRAA